MTDLIRKSDADAAIVACKGNGATRQACRDAIAALPAVTPKVKPLAWDRYGNAQGYGCKYMVYETRMGWNAVLYPQDAAHFQIATDAPEAEALAACSSDHAARILAALEPVTQPAQEHVNETAKTEHGTGNVLTDADLIVRLREIQGQAGLFASAAADRIEVLVKERDQWIEHTKNAVWADSEELKMINSRAERLEAALREIAAEASVPVHTWKNGIDFKKMYEGWRKIAGKRIDIARAALKGADHE